MRLWMIVGLLTALAGGGTLWYIDSLQSDIDLLRTNNKTLTDQKSELQSENKRLVSDVEAEALKVEQANKYRQDALRRLSELEDQLLATEQQLQDYKDDKQQTRRNNETFNDWLNTKHPDDVNRLLNGSDAGADN